MHASVHSRVKVFMRLFPLLTSFVWADLDGIDPFWLVNEEDYCARQPPFVYSRRQLSEGASLISSQIVFRHGARSEHQRSRCFNPGSQPKYSCSRQTSFGLVAKSEDVPRGLSLTKRYGDEASTCSLGQLLDEGTKQATRLGKFLQSAYPHLNEANIERISLYSTDTQRTLATLSVVLSAIFPSFPAPEHLAARTREFDEDFFALNIPNCRSFAELRANYRSSSLYKSALQSDAYRRCSDLWKSTFSTEFDLRFADDCLVSAKCADEEFEIDADVFKCVMDISFRLRREKLGGIPSSPYYRNGTLLCKIGSHMVFSEILSSVRKGEVGGLYAIHDETFVCLLSSLGLWDLVWPKYAEFISFEFFSDGMVRIVRNGIPIATVSDSTLSLFESESELTSLCSQGL